MPVPARRRTAAARTARNPGLPMMVLVTLAATAAVGPAVMKDAVFRAGTQPDPAVSVTGGAGAEPKSPSTQPFPSPSNSLAASSAPATLPVPPVVDRSPRADRFLARQVAAPLLGASAAVAYALRQLGKPYRFGAAGESAFDCSGLVMRAWREGGVSLPHNAAAMAGAGRRVRRAELRPGDLVILYNYGHVQLYIGDDKVVEAPKPGTVVRVSSLSSRVDALVRVSV